MFKKIKLIHQKSSIAIIILLCITNILSMEEIPGSSSPKHLEDAAKYYVEMLNQCNSEEKPDEFKKDFTKYIESIKEKAPTEQFQIYICMIKEAVNSQNKELTSCICKELIDCYNTNLKRSKETRQSALTQIEEKVLTLETSLEFPCFDELRQQVCSHYFTQKKASKENEEVLYDMQEAMNQSILVDEKVLFGLTIDFLNNWPNSRELLSETIAPYSPKTQFNILSSCIEIALEQQNKEQALELYKMLKVIYKTYLAETESAHLFKKEFQELAKKYPDLPSKKLNKDDFHSNLTKVNFNPEKYIITQIKSPGRSSRHAKNTRKHAIIWQKPSTILLSDLAHAFYLRNSLLLAANAEGNINCYDIKSGKWKKILQYPGQTPLLFSSHELLIDSKGLISSIVSDKINILSSNQNSAPFCSLYATKNKDDMSYLLQGNESGTLVLHDLTEKKEYPFEEKHAAPITALLALAHVAYSGAKDRTIKKWNIKEKKCENIIEEMEDIIHKFVLLRGNVITLMGTKKLVLCNLSEKPATTLPLFQLSHKEKNNSIETITTFNNEYLIAGCKNGQLKIFTFGDGFANIRNIDRDVPISAPVKTLTNFEDEKLLIQYGDKTAMIFSKG